MAGIRDLASTTLKQGALGFAAKALSLSVGVRNLGIEFNGLLEISRKGAIQSSTNS
jgi:hypothetical protein